MHDPQPAGNQDTLARSREIISPARKIAFASYGAPFCGGRQKYRRAITIGSYIQLLPTTAERTFQTRRRQPYWRNDLCFIIRTHTHALRRSKATFDSLGTAYFSAESRSPGARFLIIYEFVRRNTPHGHYIYYCCCCCFLKRTSRPRRYRL